MPLHASLKRQGIDSFVRSILLEPNPSDTELTIRSAASEGSEHLSSFNRAKPKSLERFLLHQPRISVTKMQSYNICIQH